MPGRRLCPGRHPLPVDRHQLGVLLRRGDLVPHQDAQEVPAVGGQAGGGALLGGVPPHPGRGAEEVLRR